MPRRCHKHHVNVPIRAECPKCVEELEHPRDVAQMTPAERLKEFKEWAGDDACLEVELDRLMPRISALVGRKVYTHELAGYALEVEILGEQESPRLIRPRDWDGTGTEFISMIGSGGKSADDPQTYFWSADSSKIHTPNLKEILAHDTGVMQ